MGFVPARGLVSEPSRIEPFVLPGHLGFALDAMRLRAGHPSLGEGSILVFFADGTAASLGLDRPLAREGLAFEPCDEEFPAARLRERSRRSRPTAR